MFPQLFGKYVLERELASGGMARVYLATLRGAVGFEKRLVVKQIRPELASDQAFVRRFVEEAKTTVELSHPNIVPVYELGVEQGVYYIAMELCAGVTLAEVLARTGRLSPEEGAYLGVEICRALDYAHRRAGVVHRDVTPRNVLIDEEGAVRVIDFGIAAPVASAAGGSAEVFGSPGHMPPEQLAGKALSAATDVFAVAALLVEAWTGRAPFRRKTARASEEALREPLPPLSSMEPRLEPVSELIARGLALDPATRPADAELLSRPLRDFLRNVDSGDVARRLGQRVQKSLRAAERHGALTTPPTQGITASVADDGNRISSAPESSGGRVPTHTFAAREEVSQWTRRIDADAPPQGGGADPSTRKLPSERPAPDTVEERAALGAPQPRRAPSAREEMSEPSRAAPSGFVGAIEAAPAPAARRARAPLWPGAALGLAALTLSVAVWVSRRPQPPALNALSPPAAAAPSRAPALPAKPDVLALRAAASAAARSEASKAAPLHATSVGSAAVVRRAAAAGSAHDAAAPVSATAASVETASASLRLTADPPAAVSVTGPGGARALTTPASVPKLAPGAYVLTFRNDTYGQPVVTRVTLAPASARSVHVDFREAEPRVSVR